MVFCVLLALTRRLCRYVALSKRLCLHVAVGHTTSSRMSSSKVGTCRASVASLLGSCLHVAVGHAISSQVSSNEIGIRQNSVASLLGPWLACGRRARHLLPTFHHRGRDLPRLQGLLVGYLQGQLVGLVPWLPPQAFHLHSLAHSRVRSRQGKDRRIRLHSSSKISYNCCTFPQVSITMRWMRIS